MPVMKAQNVCAFAWSAVFLVLYFYTDSSALRTDHIDLGDAGRIDQRIASLDCM